MREVRGENAGRSLQGVTQPSKVRQAGDRSAQHSRVAAPWTPHGDDEKHFKALNQAGTGTGTLSESKGIWSMHQSHSLWLKGLRLKVSITVLWSPICLWGGRGFPLLPFFFHAICSSDSHTRWKNFPSPVDQWIPPREIPWEAHAALDVTEKTEDACVGSVAQDGCQLTQESYYMIGSQRVGV